jgi:hypothetical protein
LRSRGFESKRRQVEGRRRIERVCLFCLSSLRLKGVSDTKLLNFKKKKSMHMHMHVVVVSICFSSKNCDLQNFDFFTFKIKFLLLLYVDMKIKNFKNILFLYIFE